MKSVIITSIVAATVLAHLAIVQYTDGSLRKLRVAEDNNLYMLEEGYILAFFAGTNYGVTNEYTIHMPIEDILRAQRQAWRERREK